MSQLSENMKSLRIMHGYSLKDIGDKLGCTANTVGNWEKDINPPKLHYIEDLCKIYNITPNQFFGFEPCEELESFKKSNEKLLIELENLQKQKSEIETKLRMYHDMLYRRK